MSADDPVSNCEDTTKIGVISNEDPGPYEGMEFTSMDEAKNYYTMYARKKGFTFRMGRVTKSRTNGAIIEVHNFSEYIERRPKYKNVLLTYLLIRLAPSKIASVLAIESGGVENMDIDEQLANVFWVDSRSRMAYKS
ncbi:hypothetical protein PIB30_062100 [Stylosanthes scabra]|uniref:Protein FAR1-RELATED SEQUENCE n=1 Tax=Stylosanthes scabra TaxID=79078 RepID=A0ABU6RLD8_9FABA|nr:hypothetical protein [Stylosanthes scabra]